MAFGRRSPGQPQWWLAAFSSTFLTPSTVAWDTNLLKRAASVRKKVLDFPSYQDLEHPSAYPKPDGSGMRGYCNWILPRWVMVGQYPGQSPELDGPSAEDVKLHMDSIINDSGVNLFCSLQSEIPSQTDQVSWSDGKIYLPDPDDRRRFPGPFTHYAPLAQSLQPECQFIHAPIEDLSVPNSESLQTLLLQLLTAIDEEDRCIYVHCWGGRGRAGLVASCLLSLLFPEVDASVILDVIQTGYDARAGAENMPYALSKSPQTESQRDFVRIFVHERQRVHAKK